MQGKLKIIILSLWLRSNNSVYDISIYDMDIVLTYSMDTVPIYTMDTVLIYTIDMVPTFACVAVIIS